MHEMPDRLYRSTLRDEHARLTQRRLVQAATELFVAHGYAAATIDAIATRAGVSRRTVFSSVGGKSALLKLAFEHTLAGDDAPVAIAERPPMQQIMQRDDPAELLDEWIALNATIARRIAALHHIVAVAADDDRDAAALLSLTDEQRDIGNRILIERLAQLGALRADLDVGRAADMADMLIDPCLYRRLANTHHWSFEDYVTHVQHLGRSSLLEDRIPD